MKYSEKTLSKAHDLLHNPAKMLQDKDVPSVWWVRSQDDSKAYRVQSDYDEQTRALSYITCTCMHGLNSGAGATRCYHAAAVLLRLLEPSDQDG